MKAFVVIVLLLMGAVSAQATSLKGGYVACISEDLFDQATKALVNKDERAFKYLQKNGCVVAKAGIPVSVLETIWPGTVKVRAYIGDSAIVLFTNSENIVK
jgi:hypothetical protein